MKPYLLVTDDFVKTGGMDRANYALASYLARQGRQVHLVGHRAAADLLAWPNVVWHRVPRPIRLHLVSGRTLDWVGRYWSRRITKHGGRVVVNGGNCCWRDVNWVHYVHAAYTPETAGSTLYRLKTRLTQCYDRTTERVTLARSGTIICNSQRTRRDVLEKLQLPEGRVKVVYYGTDGKCFAPVSAAERAHLRAVLAWPESQPCLAFIGALGDRRKGFDTVFAAWQQLCAEPAWDANLVVIGSGAELPAWQASAARCGLASRIRFLGFRADVPDVLKACDALLAPTRYEAYGLGVQEALCCALPAFVSAAAGVAERYPPELRDLLLPDPDDVADLVARLRAWRAEPDRYHTALLRLSERLRSYTWDDMAERMVELVEAS